MECSLPIDEDALRDELKGLSINSATEDNESQASANKHDLPVTDVREWSVEQVCEWLRSQGLSALEASFVENDMTGAELLRLDTDARLRLGLSKAEEQQLLEDAIEQLRQVLAPKGLPCECEARSQLPCTPSASRAAPG